MISIIRSSILYTPRVGSFLFFFSQRENFFFSVERKRVGEREREHTRKDKKYSPGLYWLNTELSVEPLRFDIWQHYEIYDIFENERLETERAQASVGYVQFSVAPFFSMNIRGEGRAPSFFCLFTEKKNIFNFITREKIK